MKKFITICAVLGVVLAVSGVAQAAIQTYSIVDYPAYQLDTTTGLTDHVSGTLTADPTTGVIDSASFTITGATSYTVASATIDPYYVVVTPTQITLTQTNPSNPLGYGNLRLSGSTGVSGANSSAVLQWYTPGDPWVPGSNPWAGYMGTVGSKGSGPLFGTAGGLGTDYPWVVATAVPEPANINMDTLNWTVSYRIPNNTASPDDNRGLALDSTGQYMYVGYNNGSTTMTVNKIQLSTGNVVASKSGIRGKSIAVDDVGRVYTTGINGEGIFIYSSDLSSTLYSITMTKTEGLTVRREGEALVLYATERNTPDLYRWVLTESGDGITANTAEGLGGTGHILVTGASDLRGVAVDDEGRIWLAGAGQNKVWRINSDGTGLTSIAINTPYYFGISGNQVFVTQMLNRKVAVLDADTMAVTHTIGDDIAIPWLDLGLDADGAGDPRNGLIGNFGAISGIAMLPSGTGFYLTNERGVSLDGEYREAVLGVNVPQPAICMFVLSGDLNNDCKVDFADMKILCEQWLQPPVLPSADIAPSPDGDGIVNFSDFAYMALNWLIDCNTNPSCPACVPK